MRQPAPKNARKRWLLAVLGILVIWGAALLIAFQRTADTTAVQAGYRFEAKLPIVDGVITTIQSAAPDSLALNAVATDFIESSISLLGGSGLAPGVALQPRPFIDSSKIEAVWPDGTHLTRVSSTKLAEGLFRTELMLLDKDEKPLSGRYTVDTGGPLILRGGIVYKIITGDPADGVKITATQEGGSELPYCELPDGISRGWAWDNGELTFAAMTQGGKVMVFAGSPPQWRERTGLSRLGATAVAIPGSRRIFWLTDSFAAWQAKGTVWLVADDGSTHSLPIIDPRSSNPDGSPRSPVFQTIDAIAATENIDVSAAVAAREGRRIPATAFATHSRLRLFSPSSVAVADPHYRRVVLISRVAANLVPPATPADDE